MIFVTGLGAFVFGLILLYVSFWSTSWRFDAETAFCGILLTILGALQWATLW